MPECSLIPQWFHASWFSFLFFVTQECKPVIAAFPGKARGGERLAGIRVTGWLRLEGPLKMFWSNPLQGIKQGQLEVV